MWKLSPEMQPHVSVIVDPSNFSSSNTLALSSRRRREYSRRQYACYTHWLVLFKKTRSPKHDVPRLWRAYAKYSEAIPFPVLYTLTSRPPAILSVQHRTESLLCGLCLKLDIRSKVQPRQ